MFFNEHIVHVPARTLMDSGLPLRRLAIPALECVSTVDKPNPNLALTLTFGMASRNP